MCYFVFVDETNGAIEGRKDVCTDGRTDTTSYSDAETHLKKGNKSNVVIHGRSDGPTFFMKSIAHTIFRCVLASLYEGACVRLSVLPSVRPSVGPPVGRSIRHSVRWLVLIQFSSNSEID